MTIRNLSAEDAPTELSRLIAPGVLGFYTHFEVTEVFAKQNGHNPAINVFSIAVAEDRGSEAVQAPALLNSERIKLKSLAGWNFGVMRYTQPITELVPSLEVLSNTGEWKQSGKTLCFGKVVALTPSFVPPDTATPVPLNHVLKNNFWNGSHLLEWSSQEKVALQPLFDDPRRLQELSEEVQKCVPLRLASLSDRLGNFLLQLPVTVLMSRFGRSQKNDGFAAKIVWHAKAKPRVLRANCDLNFDGVVVGYMSSAIQSPETLLPMPSNRGLHRGVIWDEENKIILADTGPSSFINTISFGINMVDPEPRVFSTKQKDGSTKSYRITLLNQPIKSIVGEPESDANGGWTRKRIYSDEVAKLTKERRFVQYKPVMGKQQDEHEKALEDIRLLINSYGQDGVWIWDPYLSAHDILETLFHCKHSGAALRALTSGKKAPENLSILEGILIKVRFYWGKLKNWITGQQKLNFADMQRAELENSQCNWHGLNLEYRIKRGTAGWEFHDRFLIFPKNDDRGALAWSLGTSVNMLGSAHHILQRVDDGQLVVDAFLDLWDQLDKPEHLIWKKP
ncbi:MAG: hypothetical protein GC139_06455 [Sideroxydans sp.]|nr:hypothetical protein [Sideroxydans sp.]